MPKVKDWTEIIDGKEVKFYRVRGRPEGREKQKIFRSDKHKAPMTQRDKLAAEWKRLEQLQRGEQVPPAQKFARPGASFQDVADAFIRGREALGLELPTIDDYKAAVKNHLKPWVIFRGKAHDIRLISEFDMTALKADLEAGKFTVKAKRPEPSETGEMKFDPTGKPLGIVAQRKLLTLMKALLKTAKALGHLGEVPGLTLKIDMPSKLRTERARSRRDWVWQFDQVRTLLRAADRLANDPDARRRKAWVVYRPMVYTTVLTGVRISEALAVKMGQMDLDRFVIHLEGGITRRRTLSPGKNGAAFRDIRIHRGLANILRKYLVQVGKAEAPPDTFLFSTDKGQAIRPRTAHQRGWEVLVQEANKMAKEDPQFVRIDAEGVAWHGFRRFLNSLMIQSDVHQAAVMKFLGHTDAGMTARYTFGLEGRHTLDELFLTEDLEPLPETVAQAS